MDAQAAGPVVVLVVGSGRSGTSTLTGVLQRAGFHAPEPHVPADESNPRGFGEPLWVVERHDRLLAEALVRITDARPSAWQACDAVGAAPRTAATLRSWLRDQLSDHPRLVLKDPRLVWFAGAWARAATDLGASVGYVTMLRDPLEVLVSRSMHYRTAMGPAHGVAQWVNLTLGTERHTRGGVRTWVRYDDLLADPVAAVRRVGEALGSTSLAEPEASVVRAVRDFVDPGLRRSSGSWDDVPVADALRGLAQDTWSTVARLGSVDGPAVPDRLEAELDACWQRYVGMYHDAEALVASSLVAVRREAIAQWSLRGRWSRLRTGALSRVARSGRGADRGTRP